MPLADDLQLPPTWGFDDREPLNTRPDDEENGALYKVNWVPGKPRRMITAENNSTGEASFVVPFSHKPIFEQDTLGFSEYEAGLNYLKRHLPLVHGDPTDWTLTLRALEEIDHYSPTTGQKFVAENEDGNEDEGQLSKGWPIEEMSLYRAHFIQRPYRRLTDEQVIDLVVPELGRYCTRFPETEGFHRKTTQWQFVFAAAPTVIAPAYGALPQYSQRWTYITFQWPWTYEAGGSVPIGTIARTLGKVNDSAFDEFMELDAEDGGTLTGFPAGELLYRECRLTQPYRGASGDSFFVDVMHVFDWNPNGWQKALRPDLSGVHYDEVHKEGDATQTPFQTANFDRLFFPRGAP